MGSPVLLDDAQVLSFLRQGYVTMGANLPETTHGQILDEVQRVFAADGNPGNDILSRVEALHQVLNAPTVAGALTSLLGPDHLLHPHRHCHLNPAGSDGQRMHQDSYEADQNVRHHRVRWLMAFYYPQDVDERMGPSSVVPATQHLTAQAQGCDHELPLHGRAGTVTIVHYDLWHRAMANVGDRDRFMVKFLFTRLTEPSGPTWQHDGSPWERMPDDDPGDAELICRQNWAWLCGAENRSLNPDVSGSGSLDALQRQLTAADESERLAAAYRLGCAGARAVPRLVDALRAEGAARVEANLERSHTNPAQFDASYGLTTAGAVAVPALMALLKDEAWWLRSSAADILGDMGRDATDATSALAATLSDSSEWVRRNAAEALGIIGSAAAQVGTAQLAGPSASQSGSPAGDTQAGDTQPGDALAACLQDESVAVRHNAALALARMGGGPQEALRAATRDESIYVSELSKIALERS